MRKKNMNQQANLKNINNCFCASDRFNKAKKQMKFKKKINSSTCTLMSNNIDNLSMC